MADDENTSWEYRLVYPTGVSEFDRVKAENRARALLERLKLPSTLSTAEAHRLAVAARACAKLAQNRVLEGYALEALNRFPKTYTEAERLAIHAKARAALERSRHQGQAVTAIAARRARAGHEATLRKIAGLIRKLEMHTVARGCTAAQEAAARKTIESLRRAARGLGGSLNRPGLDGLTTSELQRFQSWFKRR